MNFFKLAYKNKRRHPDSNWGIKALQASALPLGHAAKNKNSGRRDSDPRHSAWKADALPTELLPHFRSYRFKYILHEKFLFRNIYFYTNFYIFYIKAFNAR